MERKGQRKQLEAWGTKVRPDRVCESKPEGYGLTVDILENDHIRGLFDVCSEIEIYLTLNPNGMKMRLR